MFGKFRGESEFEVLGLLGGETGAAALLYFLGKLLHGFFRDGASFAACQGGLRHIDGCEDFRTRTLAFLVWREMKPHCT